MGINAIDSTDYLSPAGELLTLSISSDDWSDSDSPREYDCTLSYCWSAAGTLDADKAMPDALSAALDRWATRGRYGAQDVDWAPVLRYLRAFGGFALVGTLHERHYGGFTLDDDPDTSRDARADGICLVPLDALEQTTQSALEIATGELDEYSKWASGEVYVAQFGYADETREDWLDTLESCSGLIGYDYAREYAAGMVDAGSLALDWRGAAESVSELLAEGIDGAALHAILSASGAARRELSGDTFGESYADATAHLGRLLAEGVPADWAVGFVLNTRGLL